MVDLAIAKMVVVIFLQTMHSKQIMDRKWALVEKEFQRNVIMSAQALLKMIDAITTNKHTKAKMEAFHTNPDAYVDWGSILHAMYDLELKDFGFTVRYAHMAICLAEGALEDASMQRILFDKKQIMHGVPARSLMDSLGGRERLPGPGCVSLYFHRDAPRTDKVYLRTKYASVPKCAPALFGATSTVEERKAERAASSGASTSASTSASLSALDPMDLQNDGTQERPGDGTQVLRENENSARHAGFRSCRLAVAAAHKGDYQLSVAQEWEHELHATPTLEQQRRCQPDNVVCLSSEDAHRENLPHPRFVELLKLQPQPVPLTCGPVPERPRSFWSGKLIEYNKIYGGRNHINHRCNVLELLLFCLGDNADDISSRLQKAYDPVVANAFALVSREDLQNPIKPPSAWRLACIDEKEHAQRGEEMNVPFEEIKRRVKEAYETNGCSYLSKDSQKSFDDEAAVARSRYNAEYDRWLKLFHSKTVPDIETAEGQLQLQKTFGQNSRARKRKGQEPVAVVELHGGASKRTRAKAKIRKHVTQFHQTLVQARKFCSCQAEKRNTMILCERDGQCTGYQWYHLKCLGDDCPSDPEDIKTVFICYWCRKSGFSSGQASLSLSAPEVASAPALSLSAPEAASAPSAAPAPQGGAPVPAAQVSPGTSPKKPRMTGPPR